MSFFLLKNDLSIVSFYSANMNSSIIICECGCSLKKISMCAHLKTMKHERHMQLIRRASLVTCSCGSLVCRSDFAEHLQCASHDQERINAPTMELMVSAMDDLFESQGEMSDGAFLKECNIYKKTFDLLKRMGYETSETILDVDHGVYKVYNRMGEPQCKQVVYHFKST